MFLRYAAGGGGLPQMLISALLALTLGSELTLGGIVSARSGRLAATLSFEGRTRTVMAGDRAFGCDVSSIRNDAIDIVCGGVSKTLKLPTRPAKVVATPARAAAPEEPDADITFTRADLQARLDQEMSRLITETTLVPVTSRGQVAGFTLSRIPAGTILDTLGLKAGDVLVSVNDTPIDSFTTLVGLWPRLQNSGSVRAQILRDGKPVNISVGIR